MIRAADVRGDWELARPTPADQTQAQNEPPEQRHQVQRDCEVGFASGPAFLTMSACVIRL